MNFTIKTIGCKVNTYESNKIKDELIKLGLVYVDVENKNEYKNLDFYIVNTCSVTSIADKKSRQMLHLAKKHNPNVKVIAIGCLVDSLSVAANANTVGASYASPHRRGELASPHCRGELASPYRRGECLQSPHLDGVDYLLSNKEKDKLIDLISKLIINKPVGADTIRPNRRGELASPHCRGELASHKTIEADAIRPDRRGELASPSNRVRSFIKIQDGCNQYCTYCIIPYLRGNIKSRDNDDIINEVKEKVQNGVKEVVLTGIHLSSFGLDRKNLQYENEGAIDVARESLLEIMREVAEIGGIERIRLGSLEPRIINENFLESLTGRYTNAVMVNDNIVGDDILSSHVGASLRARSVGANACRALAEKFCANFCLSLQSGCDNTLKRMNRHYSTADFETACDLIRKYLPNATITTDVIVGFPGETEHDFKESLDFVKRMRFYNPNIFPYSRRKGTKADEMDGQLTNQVKRDRTRLMIAECEKISKEIEDEYNKVDHDILVEETIVENAVKYEVGYTKEYIKKKIAIKS